MEKVVFSEKVMPGQEKQDAEVAKKVEFNVNAKEFVPLYYQESLTFGEEPWNVDQQKPTINKKISDNYNPMFMDGMTEKFIHGPYMGNGRDPEIPFVRSWVSKGQELDFFNKKYFTPDPSGEIGFRPYDGSDVGLEEFVAQQKPFIDSNYVNIFRPAFIDFIVHGLLCRQYMTAGRGKAAPPMPRRGGKQPAYQTYRGPRNAESNKTLPNGVHQEEVWEDANEQATDVSMSKDALKTKDEGETAADKQGVAANKQELVADKQEVVTGMQIPAVEKQEVPESESLNKSESPKATNSEELPKEQRSRSYKRKSEYSMNSASLKEFIAEYRTKNGQTIPHPISKHIVHETDKPLVSDCTILMESLSISDKQVEKEHKDDDVKLTNGELGEH